MLVPIFRFDSFGRAVVLIGDIADVLTGEVPIAFGLKEVGDCRVASVGYVDKKGIESPGERYYKSQYTLVAHVSHTLQQFFILHIHVLLTGFSVFLNVITYGSVVGGVVGRLEVDEVGVGENG